jgi:hypothetical protein
MSIWRTKPTLRLSLADPSGFRSVIIPACVSFCAKQPAIFWGNCVLAMSVYVFVSAAATVRRRCINPPLHAGVISNGCAKQPPETWRNISGGCVADFTFV